MKEEKGKSLLYDPFNSVYPVLKNGVKVFKSTLFDTLRAEFEHSLSSSDDRITLYGLTALFSIGDTNSLTAVQGTLYSTNEFIRASAKALLLKHGEWSYVDGIAEFLNAYPNGFPNAFEHLQLQHMLYTSLSQITNAAAQPTILKILQADATPAVADTLLTSLQRFADENAIDGLFALYNNHASTQNTIYGSYKALAGIYGIPVFDTETFRKQNDRITEIITKVVKNTKQQTSLPVDAQTPKKLVSWTSDDDLKKEIETIIEEIKRESMKQ